MAVLSQRIGGWLRVAPWQLLRLGWAGNGRAVGILTIWLAWERFTRWRMAPRPVRPGAILCYIPSRYSGRPLRLRDGTVVRHGDLLIEVHLDNPVLLRESLARGWRPWLTIRILAEDLDALARRVAAGELGDVRAVHGVSLLAAESRRLGFEVHPLPRTWRWRLVRFYLVGLAALYHPRGWRGSRHLQARWPGELWLSAAELRRRLGSAP